MPRHIPLLIVLAVVLGSAAPRVIAGTDPAAAPPIDPAPCMAAIAANDDDKIITTCGLLIDSDKAEKTDRIKALLARAGVWQRRDMIDRAIGDDSAALALDPQQVDVLNARGELWRKKGDRPKALLDFGAALRLNPNHPLAKANYKSLALELERLGALLSINTKPNFNCATTKRPAERTICDNPELLKLDRQINAASTRVVSDATRTDPGAGRALQKEQDDFLAQRNAAYGTPNYDLQKAMNERLDHLLAIGH